MKPFSPSCERNQQPILEILCTVLPANASILEVGSGTGQHAVYFCERMPGWRWQTSDLPENHPGISEWQSEADLANVQSPIELDVSTDAWPDQQYDAVFSANTAHIMSWPEVCCMVKGIGSVLSNGGCFFMYGPFNMNGEFNSDSNRAFDAQLKSEAPHMGIRDIVDIEAEAKNAGMRAEKEISMPANNRALVFRKVK